MSVLTDFKIGDKVICHTLYKGTVKKLEKATILIKLDNGKLFNCHPIYIEHDEHNSN